MYTSKRGAQPASFTPGRDYTLLVDNRIDEILKSSPTVAVLGAHPERSRAAFYVPDYLHERGYRILPINPGRTGQTLWGEPVRATLAELDEPVDMVDVFRAPAHLPGHLDDVLAMDPRPKVVWLQLGIRHEGFAQACRDVGIEVVQDRCALAEHRSRGLGAPSRP